MATRGRKKQQRGKGKSRLGVLLVLLALLGGVGAWNYQRNLSLEEAEFRPYRTLSDADLAALVAATEGEAEASDRRYANARDAGRAAPSAESDRWSGFERAQQRRRAIQALGTEASGYGALLEGMRREQARRAGQGTEIERFLRLAFRF